MFKKLKRICVLLFSVCLILGCSISSYADTYDHLLSGDVGEFITPADDEISMRNARSSIATIENTVKWIPNLTTFRFRIVNEETGINSYVWKYLTDASDTQARIKYSAPDGYYISQVNMYNVYNGNYSHSPDPGTYNMELDVTSQFSNELRNVALFSQRRYDNANTVEDFEYFAPTENSGDFYLSDINLTISSGLYRWGLYWYFEGGHDGEDYVYDIDYTIRQRFEIAEPTSDNITLTPSGISSSDSNTGYQDNVSSSLSDVNTNLGNISSSMQEQATNIGKVETAVVNLQRAMEPHYDNILQQTQHITEQMAAMWTQVFNLIHVPQYARLGEILTAIQNLDVNITVDVDGLKSAVSKVSTDIQAKQESVKNSINSSLTAVQNGVTGKLQTVEDNLESTLDENTDQIDGAIEDHGNFIIDGLKSLFIPSDEFFKNYFDDLFEFFSDRFGFLAFPVELLSVFLDIFLNYNTELCVLTLPEINICGETLFRGYEFNYYEFLCTNEMFFELVEIIRLFTTLGLIAAFIDLCRNKWDEVMRN